jgi:ABC-type nitrate/sulfonate/bicarbonate transport system substrate-binding protein
MSRARLGRALATAASMLLAAAVAATAYAADKVRVANFQNVIVIPLFYGMDKGDVAVTIFPMQAAIMSNKAIGGHVLARGTLSASAGRPVTAACYFASDAWLAKNEKAAVAFGRVYLRAAKEIDADPKARLELVMKISGMTREVAQTVPASWFESLAIKKDSIAPNYDTLVSTGMMTKKFPIEDVIATLPF